MYTVVVGVDESDGARKAFEWAVGEAKARDGRVVLVHAYQPLSGYYPYSAVDGQHLRAGIEDEARQAAEDFVKRLLADVPSDDVPIEPVVTRGRASEALLARADDADVIVVGSRGHGGFAGLLLGSVSQQVVNHATCPVVVVPKRAP